MTLGQRIHHYRTSLGISQETLGAHLGVSRQAVSKWETDAATPDMKNLLALAGVFGISVAELTETPELSQIADAAPQPNSTQAQSFLYKKHRRRLAIIAVLAVILGTLLRIGIWKHDASKVPDKDLVTPDVECEDILPSPAPETDFALLWYGSSGDEEFLELGEQKIFFPFGTTLKLTEPTESHDTDFGIMTSHQADCGIINIRYFHIEEDTELDPESPEREFIYSLSTIVSDARTPRGVHPGSTKAQVISAYGDELVYCMKEEGSYTLVKHDYYYAFQTAETFGASLQFFMLDGVVAGIRVEHMADEGNLAFAPDNTSRFPLKDGEPDFSQRQDPERETLNDARRVYIAWNQLETNNNLSAEERYTYRRDIFSLLPMMDWQEFGLCGGYNLEDETRFALMVWLETQRTYTASEMQWLQLGASNPGIDGIYADRYSAVLFQAFCSDPLTFVKALSSSGSGAEPAMQRAISATAYHADLYPGDTQQALDVLIAAQQEHLLLEKESLWAEFLNLYLTTPIEKRATLPQTPQAMQ
ncbi:MAG: helix-turn-helix transcriptional regulator [Ruminococcaceae bacterium]|nr:helix-turn-helix transcriptional regulator [Oscillospiraceae bacterium]MBE6996230.1 helix-turn-helix transcriptional regulator [Oscillospiraceae bacterium]